MALPESILKIVNKVNPRAVLHGGITIPSGTSKTMLRQAFRIGSDMPSGSIPSLMDNAKHLLANTYKATHNQLINLGSNEPEMGFLQGTWETLKRSANPVNWAKAIKEVPNSIKYHRDNLADGLKVKWRLDSNDNLYRGRDWGKFMGALSGVGMDVIGTAMPIYAVFKDDPDYDTSGTFENLATKGMGLAEGLAFTEMGIKHMVPSGMGMLAALGSSAAAGMIFSPSEWVRKGGKALDNALGTGPTKEQVENKFMQRVNDRMVELSAQSPDASESNLKQQAVNDVLSNGQDYLTYLKS